MENCRPTTSTAEFMAVTPVSTSLHCLSQAKVVKYSYTWTIDNFSLCCNLVESPTFSVKANDIVDSECDIDIFPRGETADTSEYLSLLLHVMNYVKDPDDVCIKCTFSLLNIKREEENSTTKTQIMRSNGCFSFPKFIHLQRLQDEANTLLPEDKLTIRCEIAIVVERINLSQDEVVPIKVRTLWVMDALEKAFNDKTLSDVTLVADGKETHAHKLILAARSPVFAAMFQHQMKEQKSNHVYITDINHEVLTEMLRFMYTDSAPNLDKMAGDLLVAADKYALDSLKELCEEALYKSISVETAAETLVLADFHSAEGLKARTIAFINTRHATEVMATPGWQSMIPAHPHLVAEVAQALAIQLQQHLPQHNLSE